MHFFFVFFLCSHPTYIDCLHVSSSSFNVTTTPNQASRLRQLLCSQRLLLKQPTWMYKVDFAKYIYLYKTEHVMSFGWKFLLFAQTTRSEHNPQWAQTAVSTTRSEHKPQWAQPAVSITRSEHNADKRRRKFAHHKFSVHKNCLSETYPMFRLLNLRWRSFFFFLLARTLCIVTAYNQFSHPYLFTELT
jgi:hypothetical protein